MSIDLGTYIRFNSNQTINLNNKFKMSGKKFIKMVSRYTLTDFDIGK